MHLHTEMYLVLLQIIHFQVEGHNDSWHEPVGESGQDQMHEIVKLQFLLLPNHERGHVPERGEDAPRIRSHHYVDAAPSHVGRVVRTQGAHYGSHEQRRGQIVCNRAEAKCQQACDPVHAFKAEPAVQKPDPHVIEHLQLLHCVDVRHGHEQEQEHLPELQHVVPRCSRHVVQASSVVVVGERAHEPDDSSSHRHGRGLFECRPEPLLAHHEPVRKHEDQEAKQPSRRAGKVHLGSVRIQTQGRAFSTVA
mmetsp:Transcript_35477/g.67985  ORF Transcript_35477/g.67985 Transcript_35477/m.67985 type:complete len:250 (+) Transcript_35477:882-1631(+)